MSYSDPQWADPVQHIRRHRPDEPVLYFAPPVLSETARCFIDGFPGEVTYAVKANAAPEVLSTLAAAGLAGFDIASVEEARAVRQAAPGTALHFNNPVRARTEIRAAAALGVSSFAVDAASELEKLAEEVPERDAEVAVRFRVHAPGAVYDFGDKFGAAPEAAVQLLKRAHRLGFMPSLTFHPGTQCTEPRAWAAHIHAAAEISAAACVRPARLNVGGGFAARRDVAAPGLGQVFATIGAAAGQAFAGRPPALLCEPGRAMVAEAFVLAARVRAVRDAADVFLNDGTYGALAEWPDIGPSARIAAIRPDGTAVPGPARRRRVFGPTCDSLDRLPGELALPEALAEGDYLLFAGQGAYSAALATQFNGFGRIGRIGVLATGPAVT